MMVPLRKKRLLPLLPWIESHRYTPIASNQDSRWWWWWWCEDVSRKAGLALLVLGAVVVTQACLSQYSCRNHSSRNHSSSSSSSSDDKSALPPQMTPASTTTTTTLMTIDGGGGDESSEHLLSPAAAAAAAAATTAAAAAAAAATTATHMMRPSLATTLTTTEGRAAVGGGEYSEHLLSSSPPPAAAAAAAAEAAAAVLLGDVRLWGDYTSASSDAKKHDYSVEYPWEHIAEPYRTTVMEANGWANGGGSLGNGFNLRWEVNGIIVGTGPSVETTFKSPGEYKCTVTVFRDKEDQDHAAAAAAAAAAKPQLFGGTLGARSVKTPSSSPSFSSSPPSPSTSFSTTFVVSVKYIRREIRSLIDRDRETFFNAVSVMQRVPSAVGRQIYGDKYYSKDYFNRLHLHYGGQTNCDHWHDGAGFVTSHVAISLMFEQSLQAVNPSIALPYWDFTIEGTAHDWTDFRDGQVFSDDWFGNAAPPNDLRTPLRGRFGYVPVMTNATEYSPLSNPYGLLRSPWNSDSTPFLTRHDRLFGYVNNRKPSGCKQYRDALHQRSWMALTESMNEGAHGHIHELLGGTWSSAWRGFDEKTSNIIFPFLHMVVPMMKYLWRVDHLQCPSTCGQDVPAAKCQCACRTPEMPGDDPGQVLESSGVLSAVISFFYDKNLTLIDSLLDEQGHVYTSIPGYTEKETNDIFSELLHVLCTPMTIGTHYEGTSTNDITFWVLHPTFDRLWHLRRLMGDPTYVETWADDHTCYGHNPTDIQPFHHLFLGEESDRSTTYDVTDGVTDDVTGDMTGDMTGDVADDVAGDVMDDVADNVTLDWTAGVTADVTDDASTHAVTNDVTADVWGKVKGRGGGGIAPLKIYYTNEMLYDLLAPDGPNIPYIYDNFKWQHCHELGIYMHGKDRR